MSPHTDLERRIQDIIHRQSNGRGSHKRIDTSLHTAIALAVGVIVGIVASHVCAPLGITKTDNHTQPWQIRYAVSEGR